MGRVKFRESAGIKRRGPDSRLSKIVFAVVGADVMPLVHPVGGLCGGGRVVVGDDQADDFDPAIFRTDCIDVDVDRLARDQVGHVIPHEVVARDPVLVIIEHLVWVVLTTAEGGVVVSKGFPSGWIPDVIKP